VTIDENLVQYGSIGEVCGGKKRLEHMLLLLLLREMMMRVCDVLA
jgi:hypothetical protein